MEDYADDVRSLMSELGSEPVLLSWSMGGLVALMVATQPGVRACIALAPSAPAQRRDETVAAALGGIWAGRVRSDQKRQR